MLVAIIYTGLFLLVIALIFCLSVKSRAKDKQIEGTWLPDNYADWLDKQVKGYNI